MSQKQEKKIRKVHRLSAKKVLESLESEIRGLGLLGRLVLCWRILTTKKNGKGKKK